MITVRFNDVDEFIDELAATPLAAIGRRLVRVTCQYKSTETMPIRHVNVIATFIRGDDDESLVERVMLERYCGQLWTSHGDPESKKTLDKAKAQMKVIEDAAKKANLEVRAGIYE